MTNEITLWRRGDAYPADWPQWLRDANIEWCRVGVTDGAVIWHDGEWRNGVWHRGEWLGGDWRCGYWLGGSWYGGRWLGGEWYDGEAWHTGGPPTSGEARDTHGGKR